MATTRSTTYLRTRSGKRYQRNFDNEYPTEQTTFYVATRPSKRAKVEMFEDPPMEEEPATVPPEDMDFDFEEETVAANHSQVTVKGLTFEQWLDTVKTILRDTFELTEEDMRLYPFYNWFLAENDPVKIANSVKQDFYHDDDEMYAVPFQEWQRNVDELIKNKMSMSRLDLPDFPYYDYFQNSTTPMEMVNYIQGELFL